MQLAEQGRGVVFGGECGEVRGGTGGAGLRLQAALQQGRRGLVAAAGGAGVEWAAARRCVAVEQVGELEQHGFPVVLAHAGGEQRVLRQARFHEQPAALDRLAQARAGGDVGGRAHGLFQLRQHWAQRRGQLTHHRPLGQRLHGGEQRGEAVLLWQAFAQGHLRYRLAGVRQHHFQRGLGAQAEHAHLELRRQRGRGLAAGQGVVRVLRVGQGALLAGHLRFHRHAADLQHHLALLGDAERARGHHHADAPALRGSAGGGAEPGECGEAGGLDDHARLLRPTATVVPDTRRLVEG